MKDRETMPNEEPLHEPGAVRTDDVATPGGAPPRAAGPWSAPLRVVAIFVCFGILTGWIELGILGFRKYVEHRPAFGMDHLYTIKADYRLFWVLPTAEVVTLLVPALLLALLTAVRPNTRTLFRSVLVAGFFGFISILLNFSWLHLAAALLLAVGAAIQTARLASRHVVVFERLVPRALAWMVAIVVVTGGGISAWYNWEERRLMSQTRASDAPNVLLIILDTVRGFNISASGYERETTPQMARFAKGGVLFQRAYSTAPWTLPSHASIFTGRFPHELSADMQSPLDDTWPTLAEAMAERGYSTSAFVANLAFCVSESGLDRGFAHYDDLGLSVGLLLHSSAILRSARIVQSAAQFLGADAFLFHKDADQINRDFLEWLPATSGRPFFAFLNYIDAHRPYVAPPPFDVRFSASREQLSRLNSMIPRGAKTKLPPEAADAIRNAYDAALSYLDDRIGLLLGELERRGLLQNTVVVITSDHGEQFGEHGLFFHANSLYTQLLRVPLIIAGPTRVPHGTTVEAAVSLRDLPATILDLVDHGGRSPFPGASLARHWEDSSGVNLRMLPLGAELGRKAQLIEDFAPRTDGQRSVFVDGMHYILSGKNQRTGKIREELYNVDSDPREELDLSDSETGRQLLPRLRITLDSLLPKPRGGRAVGGVPASR